MAEQNLGYNVGWHLWNMSKRISSVKGSARKARGHLEDPVAQSDWSEDDRVHLRELTERLEACAADADLLWQRLQETATARDPRLVEPTDSGVSIIRNHGDDPIAMRALWRTWGERGDVLDVGGKLGEDLDRLLEKRGTG